MKTVFVMLSGGVDSSVAAALLLEQGYNVVGVFMKCWSIESLTSMGVDAELYGCFWEEDSRDARLVANKLGIPFYVWNFEDEYKQGVVDYMVEEYRAGRTPNPDVMCNSVIKFGVFYKRALKLGADFVATGHYARVLDTRFGHRIFRGKDTLKDQSYFVWRIPVSVLPQVLMPIGEFSSKAEVRAKAEKLSLITATKKDSQGLCFVGETPVRELLLQTIGEQPGNIVEHETGKILGTHKGAFQYTIGQRHNLGLSGGPWFVYSINVESGNVYVVHDTETESLYTDYLYVENYWLDSLGEAEAQIRYRQQASHATITQDSKDKLKVTFTTPQRAIAKGQSIVFYTREGQMTGGGTII
jgi:tRNA-uridine 2-sulfurtransferase